jgi:hypothetical protein
MFKMTLEVSPESLEIITTTNRGMNSDEWARLCVRNLVGLSNDYPQVILLQLATFKERCERIIASYMEMAYATSYSRTGLALQEEGFVMEGSVVSNLKTKNLNLKKLGMLSIDDWTELCVDQIISISDDSPEFIREQAHEFRDKCLAIISRYMGKAVLSSSTTMYANLQQNHYYDTADIVAELKGKPLK